MEHEKQLITALQQGSHEAFRMLYNVYKRRVCSFIFSMLNSYDETEEVFQSVFEKLWEHRADLNTDLSFSAYIYKISRNQVYDILRQRNSRLMLEKHLTVNVEKSDNRLESATADRDFNHYIYSLIDRLPERRREIFLLRYTGHLSYREIAFQLGITENTVDSQIRHALHFLRAHIGKELFAVLTIAALNL